MKILVVEDDVALQNLLKKNFQLKECQIDQVFEGDAALKKLRFGDYSLAIIDLMLPNLGGEQLVSAVRNMGIKTPVIVLSAIQDLATKTKLLEAGADDYVVKPFSFEELYARILAVVRRTKDDFSQHELVFDGLELLPDHTTLIVEGESYKLRRKEHELMQYLMQHSKQVVSRDELIHGVWDYEGEAYSNTLDAHISVLRTKLKKAGKPNMIQTIHGVGYMLVEAE